AADGFRAGQAGRIALGGVPVVALHVVAPAGDGRDRQAVARIGVPAQEAAGIAHDELALVGAHGGAVGIGNARVDRAGRALGAQGQFGRLFGGDRPGVVQRQVRDVGGQLVGVGQAGGRVGGSVAGNVPGRL